MLCLTDDRIYDFFATTDSEKVDYEVFLSRRGCTYFRGRRDWFYRKRGGGGGGGNFGEQGQQENKHDFYGTGKQGLFQRNKVTVIPAYPVGPQILHRFHCNMPSVKIS